MANLHLLRVGSLILSMTIVDGCAIGVEERARTFTPDVENPAVLLYRQEAEELRAAAHYYEGEAQRSVQESGQDSERARRYRAFAQQASVQANDADRYAEEYHRQ